jgi:hypothetical protein
MSCEELFTVCFPWLIVFLYVSSAADGGPDHGRRGAGGAAQTRGTGKALCIEGDRLLCPFCVRGACCVVAAAGYMAGFPPMPPLSGVIIGFPGHAGD